MTSQLFITLERLSCNLCLLCNVFLNILLQKHDKERSIQIVKILSPAPVIVNMMLKKFATVVGALALPSSNFVLMFTAQRHGFETDEQYTCGCRISC